MCLYELYHSLKVIILCEVVVFLTMFLSKWCLVGLNNIFLLFNIGLMVIDLNVSFFYVGGEELCLFDVIGYIKC